ncbi:unnamed protein product, partial [Strongylus vulgaris]
MEVEAKIQISIDYCLLLPAHSQRAVQKTCLQDKKPGEPYGLQGTNHLLPGKGKIHSRLPVKLTFFVQVHMKKDKVYAWCSCGYSGNQ